MSRRLVVQATTGLVAVVGVEMVATRCHKYHVDVASDYRLLTIYLFQDKQCKYPCCIS